MSKRRQASYCKTWVTSKSDPAGSAAWPDCSPTRRPSSAPARATVDARAKRARPVFIAQGAEHLARDEPRVSAATSVAPVEVSRFPTPEAVLELRVSRNASGVLHRRR